MKPIIFSYHALKRIRQRSGIEKYAEKMFRKATLLNTAKDGTLYYKNGKLRFIAKENPDAITIVTVIKDD